MQPPTAGLLGLYPLLIRFEFLLAFPYFLLAQRASCLSADVARSCSFWGANPIGARKGAPSLRVVSAERSSPSTMTLVVGSLGVLLEGCGVTSLMVMHELPCRLVFSETWLLVSGVLGNLASGILNSRKLGFRHKGFSETEGHEEGAKRFSQIEQDNANPLAARVRVDESELRAAILRTAKRLQVLARDLEDTEVVCD